MTRVIATIKMLAPMVAVGVTTLTPFYGKYHWFIVAVAVANALGLAAPTMLPSQATKGQTGG